MSRSIMGQHDKLPIGVAQEPVEEARHPPLEAVMSPIEQQNKQKKSITFAETSESSETYPSQKIGVYKEALSQPELELTQRQRLQWLQKRRTLGLWVQCDECNRWRFLPHVLDNHELPDKWYCRMNPDVTAANCSVPEYPIRVRDEEDLIHSEYTAGSVVWARMAGFPWWPAMVDDDPDTEQYYWLDGFSDIPTHYNVVFFDSVNVTRAWIAPEQLKPYRNNKKTLMHIVEDKKYKKRIEAAITQAEDAEKLSLHSRLAKYSFIARYPGPINKPRNINKNDLIKYKNKLRRKYNVVYPDESTEESDEAYETEESGQHDCSVKKLNIILSGSPKRLKKKISSFAKKCNKTNNVNTVQVSLAGDVDSMEPHEEVNQADSMTVQVGTTATSTVAEGSPDNDTSKTYVPESMGKEESVLLNTMVPDVQTRVASPGSDDFEF